MRRSLTPLVLLSALSACNDLPESPTTPLTRMNAPAMLAVTPIVTFIGTGTTYPADINNDDVVTGYFYTPSFQTHAFRWTASGGLVDIHAAAGVTWVITYGNAISNAGHIVGLGYATYSSDPTAWMWTPANPTLRRLSTQTYSYARGVNDAGMAVGHAKVGVAYRAAAWLPNGSELLTSFASDAYGVNNAGQVVVAPSGIGFAVWSPLSDPSGASMRVVRASDFPGSGWSYLQGLSIDEAGRVLGLGGRSDGNRYGFVWTPGPGAGMVSMLANPPGVQSTVSRSSNVGGEIVGEASSFSSWPWTTHALYWRNATAAPDILPNPLGSSQAAAAAINDLGKVVGTSTSPSFTRGVLWDLRGPPPPPPNQSPIADAGVDQVQECTSANGAYGILNGRGSSDPDGSIVSYEWRENGVVIATGPGRAVLLSLGTHTITLTVTDDKGATDTDDIIVIVRDTQAPDISLFVSPTELWPPNFRMYQVANDISASDLCSAPTLGVSVSANEGDASDWNVVSGANGVFDVFVRAARDGANGARVYTITATATDNSGNRSTRVGTVTVPHDQGKKP